MSSAPRVAILISGGGSNMVALVEAMTRGDVAAMPCLVLANDPGAGGLERAQKLGVATGVVNHKTFQSRAAFEDQLITEITQARADIVCLAGFMRILTARFVDHFAGRLLNIHPSLLPLFTGLDTHQRALDAGICVHGASVHEVTSELDAGRILGQAAVPVLAGDTAQTLAARVLVQEHKLYPAVLQSFIAGNAAPIAIFPEI